MSLESGADAMNMTDAELLNLWDDCKRAAEQTAPTRPVEYRLILALREFMDETDRIAERSAIPRDPESTE